MTSLLDAFDSSVAAHPDRVAIIDGQGQITTFKKLEERSKTLYAHWHRKGIRPGDRVLLAMPISADLYASLAALWRLGATVVLPEPAMGLRGLRHAARTTKPKAFLSGGAYGLLKYTLPELWGCTHLRLRGRGAPPTLPPPDEQDIALISFTSGTTGAPKAIPRSHAFLMAQHAAVAPLLASDADERDLIAFPVFVLINIAEGRTSILPNWKMSKLAQLTPTQLADWITKTQATRALLPPALCETLSRAAPPKTLHSLFTGGGPVFPDLLDRLSTYTTTCVYGSTEAEPIAHLPAAEITPEHRARMAQGHGLYVGHPVPEVQLRIHNDEVQVAGGHVNAGYLNPAHDAENKIREGSTIWHRTCDAGRLDPDGTLWLLGRLGSKVQINDRPTYPFSIEVAARLWPGVDHCALMDTPTGPCLVIQGDASHESTWHREATSLGIPRTQRIAQIPMDARHNSKVDRKALSVLLD